MVQRALPRDLLLDFGREWATDSSSTFNDRQSLSSEGPEQTTPEGEKGTVATFNKRLSFLKVEVESRGNLPALQGLDKTYPSNEIPSPRPKPNSKMRGSNA
ncbi:hypothetical protein MRX96_032621 [Rhipicephalus microplus]